MVSHRVITFPADELPLQSRDEAAFLPGEDVISSNMSNSKEKQLSTFQGNEFRRSTRSSPLIEK